MSLGAIHSRFCNISVVFVQRNGPSHELMKDVDMVTLQRSLFLNTGVNWSSLVSCMSVTGIPCG